MCDCMGCGNGQECYYKQFTPDEWYQIQGDCDETEDHKDLWGINNSIGGIEKWIEEKAKSLTSEYNEELDVAWNGIYHWLEMMDECEGGILGVYQREMKRKEKKLNIGLCKFFTISPSGTNQKDMTEEKLLTFGRRIKKLYNDFDGVLEFGKHKDRPHLHLHYLGSIKNSKHHMRSLKTEWNKIFPGNKALHNEKKNDKEYFVSIHTESDKMIPYVDWLAEKKLYFVNESKGSHENFRNSIVL